MDTQQLLTRIDTLIDKAKLTVTTIRRDPDDVVSYVDGSLMKATRVSGLSFIEKLFGTDHSYYKEFDLESSNDYDYNATKSLVILEQIREEIEQGLIYSMKSLISADIFTDFIEMAEHLHENQYSLAAAVVAGSALESHLKSLAESNGIAVTIQIKDREAPKKADTINADLVKAGVYTKLEQKIVIAWLGIRNEAAHGNSEAFSDEQVNSMIRDLPGFISKYAK